MPRLATTSRHSVSLRALLVAAAAAAPIAPTALAAGPLAPPVGAPAPTYKTLAEVEPRVAVGPATTPGDAAAVYAITQPGSYYLAGNLTGASGKAVISIRTTGVTLDLNGFTITGGVGSLHGIDAHLPGAAGGVIVRNGHVRQCGGSGVRVSAERSLIEGIIASDSTDYGIVAAAGSRVTGCTASGNRQGFFAADNVTLERCTALDNTERGIHLVRATAVGCTARANGTTGFSGDGDCTTLDCTARGNDAQGFHFPGSLNARNCTASENGQSGIMAGSGTIRDCSAHANISHGIRVDYSSVVEGCTATYNGGSGILAFRSSRIVGCTTRRNTSHGVYIFTGCTVSENLCEENGVFGDGDGAGVYAEGSANRIEGNNLVANDIGIQAATSNGGNFIARNTASYNPIRHEIAPGNNNAEWIVTPGEGFTSTNPWANFGI